MTTQQYTLPELLDIFGMTPKQLAKAAKISENTVRRNLDQSQTGLNTHETTAKAIANALGLEECEIKWPRGKSRNGRNAGDRTVANENHCTQSKKVLGTTNQCPTCFTTLPKVGNCGFCT